MFSFIIISWWVFLIIVIVVFCYLILKGALDIIVDLIEAGKGERIVLIVVILLWCLFILGI